jgi:Protein of unknown function (DUF3455)
VDVLRRHAEAVERGERGGQHGRRPAHKDVGAAQIRGEVAFEQGAVDEACLACQVNGTWLFTNPEAILYKTTGVPKPIGTHFLNFGTGRPVWQLKDGSSVEAARTQTASGVTGNIAWLLLQAVVTTAGSDGDRPTGTTWVQRLNTSGGVAPAGTCTPGDSTAVRYSADYFFWRAAGGDGAAA